MTSVALFGCGGWGKNLARNLSALEALACIVDPAPGADELASQLGVLRLSDPIEAYAHGGFDGVAVAAPAALHAALAHEAISRGKHVYVEKPIALHVGEARELADAAQAAGRVLMVGHLLQYHPAFIRLREMALAGEFGELWHITSSRLNLGLLRTEENVLWSFSPHDISMVLSLVGSAPDHVSAVASTHLQPGIPDTTTVHLGWNSGVTATVTASWMHPEKEQKLTVAGSKGLAVFDDRKSWDQKLAVIADPVEWSDNRPKARPLTLSPIPFAGGDPLRDEMAHFLDCMRTGDVPRTDAAEAIRVLDVLQRAQASLDAKK